jgi:hypothetical protein
MNDQNTANAVFFVDLTQIQIKTTMRVSGGCPDKEVPMKLSPLQKKILEACGITVIGFALFNVAFMMVAAILGLIMMIAKTSIQNNGLGFVIYLLILLILTILVFRSKLNIVLKAGYLCMPVMSVLVILGIVFYPYHWLVFGSAGLFIGILLGYLKMMKQPWQYLYSVLYCTVLGIIIILFNVQI